MTDASGYEAREELFEYRVKASARISQHYHIPLGDVDELSIDEWDMLLQMREEDIKARNAANNAK